MFLAKYLHDFEEKNASAEEIYHLAVLRLKAYTDEIHKKQIYDKNLLTGIVKWRKLGGIYLSLSV